MQCNYRKSTSIRQAPVFRHLRVLLESPWQFIIWMYEFCYIACCWFPTFSNILILPSQFRQITFENYWLHCPKCRILVLLWYNSFIQMINFHGLSEMLWGAEKLVPAEYWCSYGTITILFWKMEMGELELPNDAIITVFTRSPSSRVEPARRVRLAFFSSCNCNFLAPRAGSDPPFLPRQNSRIRPASWGRHGNFVYV